MNEKVFFHGNMRLYAVRLDLLLMAPDMINRLYRLYSGNKTAMTIKEIAQFAPKFCGLFPHPDERFKLSKEPVRISSIFFV